MIGPPDCSLSAFKTSLLHQCQFDLTTISLEACLGGSIDGYVWKSSLDIQARLLSRVVSWVHEMIYIAVLILLAHLRNTSSLVLGYAAGRFLSISFYPTGMPKRNPSLDDRNLHSPVHPESPILVNAAPTTRKDALNNHYAFSIEGHIRLQDKLKETPMTNTKIISEAPRLRKCYGWPNFKGRIIRNAHPSLWPPPLHIDKVDREMPLNRDYIAIVYEHIKDGENGPAIVKQMLEFLWFTGFSLVDSPHARNWTSGVLLDLCDVVPPRRSSWKSSNYGIRDVEMVLRS